MKAQSQILHSRIYTAFTAIDIGDYYKQIRFIEKNRKGLDSLELNEYLEIMVAYRQALFNTAKYREHISVADHLVRLSIMHNIQHISGEDVYYESLLQKAASHYNMEHFEQACHILHELVKIDPENETARLFLMRSLIREEKRSSSYGFRAVSSFCFLLAAFIVMLDLLFIHPFYEKYDQLAMLSYQSLFLLGLVVLIAGEARIRYRGVGKALQVIRKAKGKRS